MNERAFIHRSLLLLTIFAITFITPLFSPVSAAEMTSNSSKLQDGKNGNAQDRSLTIRMECKVLCSEVINPLVEEVLNIYCKQEKLWI
ncbi:hypothetical protein MFLO_01865 [Listeria floridensis FSL S10-1187]|uniref:Uncharacterized protein n=1 Tax=Listeria floridensis FSL S10-1187 TaxID=1265817 RepID=A0ABP3B1Y5_9LIST|nr:hypothetical protein MFLO_01865 [Listeria floridensis FSL S10-1187]